MYQEIQHKQLNILKQNVNNEIWFVRYQMIQYTNNIVCIYSALPFKSLE